MWVLAGQSLRDLVGMSLTDRLGGEEEGVGLLGDTIGDSGSSHDEGMGRTKWMLGREGKGRGGGL